MNIPIVVVAYNREKSLLRLLNSLNKAQYPQNNIKLIISIDFGDNASVIQCANDFCWEHGTKVIKCHKNNLGLKKHILSCGDIVSEYDAIIMLEDDLYVSKDFYNFAVQAFTFSQDIPQIGGVSLYNHRRTLINPKPFDTICDGFDNWYFQFASSWGQMWTRNQWQQFKQWYNDNIEFNFSASGRIPANVKKWGQKSWLKYFIAYLIETDRYFFYPKESLTTNFSEVGTNHLTYDTDYQVPLCVHTSTETYKYHFSRPEESLAVYDANFENTKLDCFLPAEDVCIDLYGDKDSFEDKPFLLTIADVTEASLICTYGRELRPHEMNVIEKIPGNEIKLYCLSKQSAKYTRTEKGKMADVKYHFRNLPYSVKKSINFLFLIETLEKAKRRFAWCFSSLVVMRSLPEKE